MTAGLRLLDTGLADAHCNVAMSAALLAAHAEGRIPDTLRFHRYRSCLLAGASERIDESGSGIVRRITGGGTVAMTPAILAWDLVVDRHPRREDAGRALARALGSFGVEAIFLPPGDVVASGRKIAGIAGAFEGTSRLHQGAVLVAGASANLHGRFCRPVRPVATLAELAPVPPSITEVADAIAVAFSAELGLPLRREAFDGLHAPLADMAPLAEAVP